LALALFAVLHAFSSSLGLLMFLATTLHGAVAIVIDLLFYTLRINPGRNNTSPRYSFTFYLGFSKMGLSFAETHGRTSGE
jgi:hypothetical protein